MTDYATSLREYLSGASVSQAELAASIEHSQAAVNRWANGRRFPDSATARRIEEATRGAVPFSLWAAEFAQRAGIAA